MSGKIVYMIATGDMKFCKIGVTSSLKNRLKNLQTSHPQKLVPIAVKSGGIIEEKEIHKMMSFWRASGEWFLFCKDVFDIFINSGGSLEIFSFPEFPQKINKINKFSDEFILNNLKDYKLPNICRSTGLRSKDVRQSLKDGKISSIFVAEKLSKYFSDLRFKEA